MISHRTYRIIGLSLLLLVATAIRFHHLDHESLWMDELRQIAYYPHAFDQITNDSVSPGQPYVFAFILSPMDYWIGHFIHYFSYSDFAVRLPSAIFGVLAVLILTLIISRLCSWPVGIGAGMIFALLPFSLYYSQEARPYATAIFLFLCVIWVLGRLLKAEGNWILIGIEFLFWVTMFLYSRALFPLAVVTSLFLIVVFWWGKSILQNGFSLDDQNKRLAIGAVAMILAFLIYFPNFKFILEGGKRYLVDTSYGFNSLLSGFNNFNVLPAWKSFAAQTEPLTIPLLMLMIFSPYFVFKLDSGVKRSLGLVCLILLPTAVMIGLFIFQAKSNMPFRPPYAFYILPLTLILSAISFKGLWEVSKKYRYKKTFLFLLISMGVFFMLDTAYSAISYKRFDRKTDWKGVSKYLTTTFGDRHILVFDSRSPYDTWEPTFYGFPRYYHGHSGMLAIRQIPFAVKELSHLQHEPIIVLFQWRKLFLTPLSRYPIVSCHFPINYEGVSQDPLLEVKEFTGFSVVRPGYLCRYQ